MSHGIPLQDWITVTGNSNVVIQNEADWLDFSPYQDLAGYFELGSATNASATSIDLQTSPSKDELFFKGSLTANDYMMRFSVSSATTPGIQTIGVNRWAAPANMPVAKWVRWRITFPTGATNVTFRIWLVGNQAGFR